MWQTKEFGAGAHSTNQITNSAFLLIAIAPIQDSLSLSARPGGGAFGSGVQSESQINKIPPHLPPPHSPLKLFLSEREQSD